MRRDDRLRKLVDRLPGRIVIWSSQRQEIRAVVGDPRRGHPHGKRPGWRTGQQYVFRLDFLGADRQHALLRWQLVGDSRHQLVGAASAATCSGTVIEPGPA
jgi:hypothetical protein